MLTTISVALYFKHMKNLFSNLTKKKQKLDRLLPLRKEVLKEIEDWLKVELTYSSNAIEGNTLTRIIILLRCQLIVRLKPILTLPQASRFYRLLRKILVLKLNLKETGETIHTLRYWTKMGLLKIAKYTEGGYQLYSPDTIKQAKKIS